MYNQNKLPNCIVCGKKLSQPGCKRCQKHSHLGKLNPSYVDGHTIKKYYCINCNKELKGTLAYKHKRCRPCTIKWQRGGK